MNANGTEFLDRINRMNRIQESMLVCVWTPSLRRVRDNAAYLGGGASSRAVESGVEPPHSMSERARDSEEGA